MNETATVVVGANGAVQKMLLAFLALFLSSTRDARGVSRRPHRSGLSRPCLRLSVFVLATLVPLVATGSMAFAATSETVPLFISASHPSQQGFVRIINHSDQTGTVAVTAIDDAGRSAELSFQLDAWETRHFNSEDLENGNAAKGIIAGVGAGMGDWRLEVESTLPLEVLAYVRTTDGFLTSMHDRARKPGRRHLVPTFNPGSNRNQVSKLRIVNTAAAQTTVDIVGVDDGGVESDEVRVVVQADAAVTLTAQELEAGPHGAANGLGDGSGKWQLYVTADQRVVVQSLLESVSGHLTNLSTSVSAGNYQPPSGGAVGDAAGDFALEHWYAPADIWFAVPTGITYANEVFYVLDGFHDEVFTYTAQGARHSEGDFPVVEYAGDIAYANGRLYVLDESNDKVLAYTTDGRRTPVVDHDFDINDIWSKGIAYANGRFYVAVDEPINADRVEVYANGERVAGAEFDLTLGRDPVDIAAGPNGRLYVLGGGAVFAYTTSGDPVSGAHFDLAADNGAPVAITYANGRFYVADDDADKVFAYTAEGQRAESQRSGQSEEIQ